MTQDDQGNDRPPPRFISDAKRLAKLGAKYGAILAFVCHLLPPHFRPICDAIASLCTGG